jgi:hypothetical protein
MPLMAARLRRFGWRRTGLVLCGCLVAVALGACSGGSEASAGGGGTESAESDFSMLGTWSGHRERMASTEGYRNGTATLVVTEETGLTFVGTMSWSTPEGEQSEPLVGAFTPGGALIAGADEEGMYSFELIGPTTLDYCYMEDGEGYRTTCARLEKQP